MAGGCAPDRPSAEPAGDGPQSDAPRKAVGAACRTGLRGQEVARTMKEAANR